MEELTGSENESTKRVKKHRENKKKAQEEKVDDEKCDKEKDTQGNVDKKKCDEKVNNKKVSSKVECNKKETDCNENVTLDIEKDLDKELEKDIDKNNMTSAYLKGIIKKWDDSKIYTLESLQDREKEYASKNKVKNYSLKNNSYEKIDENMVREMEDLERKLGVS